MAGTRRRLFHPDVALSCGAQHDINITSPCKTNNLPVTFQDNSVLSDFERYDAIQIDGNPSHSELSDTVRNAVPGPECSGSENSIHTSSTEACVSACPADVLIQPGLSSELTHNLNICTCCSTPISNRHNCVQFIEFD